MYIMYRERERVKGGAGVWISPCLVSIGLKKKQQHTKGNKQTNKQYLLHTIV